ncbi:Histidine-specific methyltransferase EgtD [Novipirellula galeiformis]|uniref:Histidine-specific methyltransferase EgtD n=1 Tax=Novipirellula galeiformis TaxID=2528004 RepID=A0A5C6BYF6_9BACT|nr:L-histidine N(alpha)-methyltransferase [Novipirellula galeiformis]TWU17360.1 Histidine-specific methyltransferase EgtD [Novipirellula galeiformis]
MTPETISRSDSFLSDVVHGLSQPRKTLPCKYLYDEHGSQLFDQICELDEYYVTRTEWSIMKQNAASIARQIDTQAMLVEYGSGSSLKTRLLLDALEQPRAYVPVDISEEHVLKTADGLRLAYPSLQVMPVIADFTQPFSLPDCEPPASHVVIYFPGSTIGNFPPPQAGGLLKQMSRMLGRDGGLLIGIDLQKEAGIIEAAYNDSAGVTAAFNLNVLQRINRELGSNFELDHFQHRAVYNRARHRVEISLVSLETQVVSLGNREVHFDAGEEIVTEYSHKYTVDGFATFAEQYGFSLHQHWTDQDHYFAVLHLVIE